MKIYLVNVSTTAGGVLSNCVSVLYENKELNPKNIEAMKIFLAGGISGNLREFLAKSNENIFGRPSLTREVMDAMKVYIAGDNNKKKILREKLYGCDFFTGKNALKGINILESFYYLRKNEEFMMLVKHFGSFLLDSGAFTFLSGSHKGGINWDEYVEEYAAICLWLTSQDYLRKTLNSKESSIN